MEYKEAAARLAALTICTDQVPVGCEQCPAFDTSLEGKEQRKRCNDMVEPAKIAEAIGLVKVYNERTGD